MAKDNVKVPPIEAVGQESIEDMIKSKREEAKQRKMEKEVYGPKSAPVAPVKKAKGGYVRAADGCAQRGKTRGKMV